MTDRRALDALLRRIARSAAIGVLALMTYLASGSLEISVVAAVIIVVVTTILLPRTIASLHPALTWMGWFSEQTEARLVMGEESGRVTTRPPQQPLSRRQRRARRR